MSRGPDWRIDNTAETLLALAAGRCPVTKSGAFVEHAQQIEERLQPNTALILSTDYIYRYIQPGDPLSPDPYGKNTYWGGKLIYKAADGNVYVASVPTRGFNPAPAFADFPSLDEILSSSGGCGARCTTTR